jgi:hypothetical protein
MQVLALWDGPLKIKHVNHKHSIIFKRFISFDIPHSVIEDPEKLS